MTNKLNSVVLGYAGASISALCMIVLGILGNLGIYTSAVNAMTQWHQFFSLSIGGIISGAIEAAIVGFIGFYIFGLFYNIFLPKRQM
jgi:hypothetical protein